MSELKCCPFCGGEAFVDTHRFWDEKAKDFTVQTYGIRCYDCQTGTSQHYRKEEDAIKRWNTRKPMDNIVEKLEKTKKKDEQRAIKTDETENISLITALQGMADRYEEAINIVKQEINNGENNT